VANEFTQMGLNTPGASTANRTTADRRNLAVIDAHDHTSGKGHSIAPAVLAAIVADGTAGDFADAVLAVLGATQPDALYGDVSGIDLTIGATTAFVPLATTADENPTHQHFTSAANLTGTVAKTASSATLVGTGTAFTTELTVGQLISVPGTAAEVFAVTAIADATHLTLSAAAANSATGQTAARLNNGFVCRVAGRYRITFSAGLTAVSAGTRTLSILVNTVLASHGNKIMAIGAANLADEVSCEVNLALWDVVQPKIASSEASSPFTGPRLSWTYLGAVA
jgi:hypothetical protein